MAFELFSYIPPSMLAVQTLSINHIFQQIENKNSNL
jgi:hypothetical protein